MIYAIAKGFIHSGSSVSGSFPSFLSLSARSSHRFVFWRAAPRLWFRYYAQNPTARPDSTWFCHLPSYLRQAAKPRARATQIVKNSTSFHYVPFLPISVFPTAQPKYRASGFGQKKPFHQPATVGARKRPQKKSLQMETFMTIL